MALISAKITPEKEKIKIEITKYIYSEIKAYCSWAGIEMYQSFYYSIIKIKKYTNILC
ncbi:hypothetical protein Ldro_2986 [Legionella drozanskii LLAP-1]|uniref:Uncharacterized protein n=1 Tax=Legionella drozanskii LLAP-1 TaxID=1212489 RepID=A0A0W0SLY5_9GAMM|nr:hypothetical protein Ldro_2986 [Legionella drozanskii LLAP-1]